MFIVAISLLVVAIVTTTDPPSLSDIIHSVSVYDIMSEVVELPSSPLNVILVIRPSLSYSNEYESE